MFYAACLVACLLGQNSQAKTVVLVGKDADGDDAIQIQWTEKDKSKKEIIRVDGATKVNRNGKKASFEDIEKGDIVASYFVDKKTKKATAISVKSRDGQGAAKSAKKASEPEAAKVEPVVREFPDLKVEVAQAVIDQPEIRQQGRSDEDCLIIMVRLTNLDENKKLEYKTWGPGRIGTNQFSATAKDDLGNTYKMYSPPLLGFVGQALSPVSLYPSKPVFDRLIFEKPLDKAKTITLTLPGKAIDKEDDIVVTVPIQRPRE